ncbi:MAG: Glycosyl transferase family 2 [Candidatus Woesebacteria bacterium GW2011_GWA1_37_8]|uniref:Glycosyl transferase family 2 n=1 Tax=Candidatus Woesebacteria bacterium GW2011_GWA1_37_8 TaxID=1618546 RepID=A0A0G0HS77_9BACT|nr:MAG: Glycosyl transferase family 2 [Microgenomates group bacterium GW2011_GWC1_37_12b]KKQ46013.1 MAG: Glycosyl transferase family 2 [Candidatus Woesebacteria bacterium GW2011_GWA1_37_8]
MLINKSKSMKNLPLITIAIATFNSESTLSKTLTSIKNQKYPRQKIEILIIDGGSIDTTLDIARQFNCSVVKNVKTELIYAKHIGYLQAKGVYLIYLDSDEVLENNDSLRIKINAFQKDTRVKGVMPTGYITPLNFASINYYINDFGDPFSYFNYRLSQNADLYINQLKKRGTIISEDETNVVFNFTSTRPRPMIELMAGGGMIDLSYFRNRFPEIKTNPSLVAFYFYYLNQDRQFLAVTKNDAIIHYSSGSLRKYTKKIASRVKNNIFETDMGKGGFSGRETFQPQWFRFKKYLFIPYSFSLILPFIDSLLLLLTRKKAIFLIHTPLCLYTTLLILYYSFLRTFGVKPVIRTYGN